ncbi:hypothetical protein [Clostridium sp. YIM B02551]|uniref:DUF6906 family protein n=1 Tax=Clostridium sp. YIM B02551 TaxID=2910679 RepID=UPI001EEBE8E9|nr:hypothetical protein [Clostridium sp. YIM B02551]
MKRGKRLTLKMKEALSEAGLDPENFLYTTKDHMYFTPLNIITKQEYDPVRFLS